MWCFIWQALTWRDSQKPRQPWSGTAIPPTEVLTRYLNNRVASVTVHELRAVLCTAVRCRISFGCADNSIKRTQLPACVAMQDVQRPCTPFVPPGFDPKSLASHHITSHHTKRRVDTQTRTSFLVQNHVSLETSRNVEGLNNKT